MASNFEIRPLEQNDIPQVTKWSRLEGFAPGAGDVTIYSHTDRQGLWVGCLDKEPIGCIAGVKYNQFYGFIGLFLVVKEERGNGYGLKLWEHVMNKLSDVRCLGLEAAPNRLLDYQSWGFVPSSITTRWMISNNTYLKSSLELKSEIKDYLLLEDKDIPSNIIQKYDENKENTPRPHFISDWISSRSGSVLAIVNRNDICTGFCRIRPCLLKDGKGFRIGPLVADSPLLATLLINKISSCYPGTILIDSPGVNLEANKLFRSLGFVQISHTIRMYKGKQPLISMREIYGLACLELG